MQIVCQSIMAYCRLSIQNFHMIYATLLHRWQMSLDSTERREVDLSHTQCTTA